MTRDFKFVAVIPQGYTIVLGPHNVLIGTHPEKPVIYLDEKKMEFVVLKVHVSEVAK